MNDSTTPIYFGPKKSNRWLIILLSVLLAVSVLFSLVLLVILSAGPSREGITIDDLPMSDYVGVLHIEGTISAADTAGLLYGTEAVYSHEYVLSAIESLKNDPFNQAILLYIDTPGGEIYATDEVYCALMEYKEETERPIYAYFATYACSGGYYLAMAADEIYAHRMSTTGSIGVSYGTHIDLSGLCEKLGVKVEDITSGDNKAMGSYFAPLTDEQRAIYESQLDEYYGYFLDVVMTGRDMTEEELRPLADGRTYTAMQALENGLIDGIEGYEDYAEDVCAKFDDAVLHDLTYTMDYDELLYSLGYSSGADRSEIEAVLAAIKPLSGVLAYYSGR